MPPYVKGKTQDWPAAGPESTEQVEGAAVVVVIVVVVVFVVVVDVVPVQLRMLQLYCPMELQTQVLQLTPSTSVMSSPGVQLVEACIDNEVEFL